MWLKTCSRLVLLIYILFDWSFVICRIKWKRAPFCHRVFFVDANTIMAVITGIQITEEEKSVIDELKRRTINLLTPKMLEDESLFYRFCKARDFNLEDAESMLRKHIMWRREYGVDTILTAYKLPEVHKYIPTSFMCFDKDGCPVRYSDCGQCDVKNMWNCLKKTDTMKTFLHILEEDMEKLDDQNKKLGKPVTKVVQVFNLENLTFANATHTKTLLNLLYYIKQYLDNYPERLKYAIVLNASIIAMMSIPILKAILPASMMQKIRIYGREGWREALLDLIDADDLPAFLGGNKTDPDGNPLCETFLIHGQPIPKKYILFNDNKTTSTISEADRMTVSRLSKSWINVEVKESDLYLEWEFETKKKDIEFVIYYREQTTEESKQVELFPKQRIEACFEPEKGLYKCDKLGTYSILFDNSYSWIYPKDIYYKIKLRGSNEIEHELM